MNKESKVLHNSWHRKLKQVQFAQLTGAMIWNALGRKHVQISAIVGVVVFQKENVQMAPEEQIYHLDLHIYNP